MSVPSMSLPLVDFPECCYYQHDNASVTRSPRARSQPENEEA